MKLREKKHFPHGTTALWHILSQPALMPSWNPRCQSSGATRPAVLGDVFEATFRIKNRPLAPARVEVIEILVEERITYRYSGEMFGSLGGYADETYHLLYRGPQQSTVRLEIDLGNIPIPGIARFLIVALHRLGKKRDSSPLDGLADLLKQPG